MKFIFLICSILLLSSCSNGNNSFLPNENAFVSGNGVVVYINEKDRNTAPNLSGPTLNSSYLEVNYSKVTVVNVWASWCAPCRAEAPVLQELSTLYPQVQFVGILTRDNLSAARAFYENFKLTYPTFIDDSLLVGFRTSLIPDAIPTTLIIDKNGKVAVRISGEVTVSGMKKMLERVLSNE
jgi:thiol-disulfide isomerase/thioredoxin